jgi:lipoprotein-anchoring transpeptidase ErfK/SrfK
MITIVSFILSLTILSPLWPIGENPTVGAPFIIVNKKTNELAFINGGEIKKTYPVATGKTEDLTPEGLFTITVRAKDPYYRKKDIPGGAKENPLGSRWIGFDALDTDGRIYGIHGNNNPESIGKYITQGCIRMYDEDVKALYKQIPVGTKILIIRSDKTFEQLGKEYNAL